MLEACTVDKKSKVTAIGVCLLLGVSVLLPTGTARAEFAFGTPENLGPAINGPLFDVGAFTSGDGLSLGFWRYAAGEPASCWIASRPSKDTPWGTPVNLGPWVPGMLASHLPDVPSWWTADGLEMPGGEQLSGGYGGLDLWMYERESVDDKWGAAENLGPVVNGAGDERKPTISRDGLELYFDAYDRSGGHGNWDLWVTRRPTRDAPWQKPENLGGKVNSDALDARPCLSADGLMLFFDSKRLGGYGEADLYVTRRKTLSDPWEEAMNLGPLVNTPAYEEIAYISADCSTLYFDSSRPDGYGGQDIWQVSVMPVVDFNGDGEVNAADMSILIDHWHTGDPLCDIGPTPWGDGIVDFRDLKVLSEYLEPGMGRIAHWKLDEAEGTVAYDSIGSDHSNVHGEAVWQPNAGVLAGALEFDGIDDYVAPMCILNPADKPFRILAWIKGGTPGQVIASQTPTEFELGGTYLAADPADGALVTEAVLPMPLKSDVVITDGEWHEVGLEWDGNYRHLSVDDNEVAVDNTILPAMENTGYLNIGTGKAFEDGSFWSGLIDDVRIYKLGEKP